MLKPLKNEIRKPTRSISGIIPVAVMLPPRKCNHGECIYCPSLDVPKSYTPKSPVVIRAREVNYDSYSQVLGRLKAFHAMHHPSDKVELIIMGGTFLEYPEKFQYQFIKGCYDALNGKKAKNLEEAKKINEKAKHRCVALCIETRPDACVKYIPRLLEFGCTRVELGVQMPDDKIYKIIKRGHNVDDVIDTTKKLKNAGFKVGYHIMPGLPGSNMNKDLQLFKKIFSDKRFRPDQLKIYPCQVIKGSELEEIFYRGKYKPYTKEETEKIIISMLKIVPRYCRVMRIMREIPPEYLIAGTTRIDLRKDAEEKLREKNSGIKEIRYREIGFNQENLNSNLNLKITKYKASEGEEYFLEIVNEDDILFGLLRLRIYPTNPSPDRLSPNLSANADIDKKLLMKKCSSNLNYFKKIRANENERDNSRIAIIRELHVYGKALKLGEEGKIGQHTGLGKWLMSEAEKIAKRSKVKKLKIISGIGVREYYRKLGYSLDGHYMVKFLN